MTNKLILTMVQKLTRKDKRTVWWLNFKCVQEHANSPFFHYFHSLCPLNYQELGDDDDDDDDDDNDWYLKLFYTQNANEIAKWMLWILNEAHLQSADPDDHAPALVDFMKDVWISLNG